MFTGNMFAYCCNAPIRMFDPTGKIGKEIHQCIIWEGGCSRIFGGRSGTFSPTTEKKSKRYFERLKSALMRVACAFDAKIDFGFGFGVDATANVSGLTVEASLGAAMDVFSAKFDNGTTRIGGEYQRGGNLIVGGLEYLNYSLEEVYWHPYNCPSGTCTCNLVVEKFPDCPLTEREPLSSVNFSLSMGGYLLVGGEINVGVDIQELWYALEELLCSILMF